jgi:hypothetical protein
LYDALYFELFVLQACALGTCLAAENRYDTLYENMRCGLLKEFDRVLELYKKLAKSN